MLVFDGSFILHPFENLRKMALITVSQERSNLANTVVGISQKQLAYLSYALTNSYAISAITVGTIFLVSRIFDGVSDVIAGVVIDRTNSKLGKARVYDLLHVPLWLCLVLLQAALISSPVCCIL